MHLKNFSLIHTQGQWQLAPAYDLLNVSIANPVDSEELALTLEGKKKKLHREHFERLGQGLGLNTRQVTSVFRRFGRKRALALDWIERSFLSREMKDAYLNVFNERYRRLGI